MEEEEDPFNASQLSGVERWLQDQSQQPSQAQAKSISLPLSQRFFPASELAPLAVILQASTAPASQFGGKRQKTAYIDGTGWKRTIPKPSQNKVIVISDDDDDDDDDGKPKQKKTKYSNQVTVTSAASSARHVTPMLTPPDTSPEESFPQGSFPLKSSLPQSSFSTTLNGSNGALYEASCRLQPKEIAPRPFPKVAYVDLSSDEEGPASQLQGPTSQSQGLSQSQGPASQSQAVMNLVDHRGRPLPDVAIQISREYWQCQREYELCPIGAEDDVQGPRPCVDTLLRMARHRRTYTQLILGLEDLHPGDRTYEPPYIPPDVVNIAPVIDVSAIDPKTHNSGPVVEPPLNAEQIKIVELAASGKNIFYTGSAGCGKSTVLHAIKKRLEGMGKVVQVMAPTGSVALAINGTTTWTFAGWNPDSYKRRLSYLEGATRHKTSPIRRRFRQTDVIIIDEISMVENLHFERLNAVMKSGRYATNDHQLKGIDAREKAFGGVQVIVTGDFCQLPPVKPFQTCMYCGREFSLDPSGGEMTYYCHGCNISYKDSDKWAFRSEAWKECGFVHILLKTIHRQRDSQFISMLQKCRMGVPFTSHELHVLQNHASITTNAVKLFSTREEVRRTNNEAFQRLKTPPLIYHCYDKFSWNREKHPNLGQKGNTNQDGSLQALSEHRLDPCIELKIGMLVVLLVNLDLSEGFCNGSQGIIANFEPYDPSKLPRKADLSKANPKGPGSSYAGVKDQHIRIFAEQQKTGLGWPIVRFHNGKTRTIYPECQVNEIGDVKPYSLLCRTQVPLTAAWALSIHKAQGMTLNRVIVNLSRAFEEGQVYVALSRATSLEGLKIDGHINGLRVGAGGNTAVREFLQQKFGQ